MIIGITGGTGSGKTTVLELLRTLGYQVLDCDAIYHRLLREDPLLLNAIESRFPGVVSEGQLQRKKLGQQVFGDPEALADLNRITHGAIIAEVKRLLTPDTAIDAIALFESGLDALCDLTVAVTAPMEQRVARLVARDQVTEEYARSRIAAQQSDGWYAGHCDCILENSGTAAEFRGKCLAFFSEQGIMKKKPDGGTP